MPIISPKIPQGLEELMKGLAKSVIKENPENIYEFAAEYFENLLHERDGTVDQGYKKFATYKVYKKTKMERRKRGKENMSNVDDNLKIQQRPSFDGKVSTIDEDNSIEKITLTDSQQLPFEVAQDTVVTSSESEINAAIKQDSFIEDEGTPQQKSVNSEDDDIKGLVLDDEMAQAAVKIQSTFRGHKARKEMKENNSEQKSCDLASVIESDDNIEEIRGDDIKGEEMLSQEDLQLEQNDENSNVDECNQSEEKIISESDVVDSVVVDEEEQKENQLNDTEIDENIKQFDDGTTGSNADEKENEINLRNCSSEANDENDDKVVHDGELSTENVDLASENEEQQNSVENLQSENVEIIMETENNREEIITNESTHESFDNGDINPDNEEKEDEQNKSDDASGDVVQAQVSEIEGQNNFSENEEIADNTSQEQEQEIQDDISGMILDDEMEEAALKIQSAFRGHKVRKNISEQNIIESSTDNPVVEDEISADAESDILNLKEEPESEENENNKSSELLQTVDDSDELNEAEKIDENEENLKSTEEQGNVEQMCDPSHENVTIEVTESKENSIENVLNVQSVDVDKLETKDTGEQSIEKCENEMEMEMENLVIESSSQVEPFEENLQDKEEDDNDNSQINEAICQDEINATTSQDEETTAGQAENLEEVTLSNQEDGSDLTANAIESSHEDVEINQSQDHNEATVDTQDQHSTENENLNLEASVDDEQQMNEEAPIEQICESTDSQEKLELKDPSNENSIDVNLKSIDSKNSLVIENQECEVEIKLENILSENISPYNLLDEVVNQEAALMATEMDINELNELLKDPDVEQAAVKIQSAFRGHKSRMETKSQQDTLKSEIFESTSIQKENDDILEEDDDIKNMVLDEEMEQAALKIQSSFRGHKVRKERKNNLEQRENDEQEEIDDNMHPINPAESSTDDKNFYDKNESNIEKITNPELLDLNVTDELLNDNDEIRDEILNPDNEESEIPEDDSVHVNDIPFPEQENCNEDETLETNATVNDVNEDEQAKITSNDDENVEDMILDDEMEDAALKIQAAFRGHQVRKEKSSTVTNDTETSKQDEESNNETIVIEQCSEGNEETQENDETEQQDTSADVDEIQESEAAEQEENEAEDTEQVQEDEEVEETTETNEQGGDDPDEPEQAEGESSTQQQNNDDDDVANMVLDEEMEQAALKIQSTFRGQKARSEIKTKQEEEEVKEATQENSTQDIDDEIANMVLDDEMEQAALKIQSAFRGNRSKKEDTETEESKDEQEEENKEDEKKEEEQEEEKKKEESTASEGSSGKSAKQLQEEEDIANLVMDEEMEKTALKIQSAFRGKIKRKPKDGTESYESSAEDYNADVEESIQRSDENPSDMYDYFGMSVECDEDDYNSYLAKRESYAYDGSYSIERYNAMDAYNETIYPSDSDVDLMHGGGIFPEPSGESGTLESTPEYSSEDNNDPPEDKNGNYKRLSSTSVNGEINQELIEQKSEEKAIESFDFDSNKDTAEAMYYSLKKNEIEAQKRFSESGGANESQEIDDLQPNNDNNNSTEENKVESFTKNESLDMQNYEEEEVDDDDDDVVMNSPCRSDVQKLKYGMSMDDRLLGSILSQDYSKGRKIYPDEMFDPLLEEAMSSNYNVLEKLHEMSKSGEEKRIDDNNVGEEDQFDDFYPGNIRSKIMASSISIADSDYFDPTNNKSIIDDDRIRTALETIHSTDSESTIGSAATKIQANDRNVPAHRNKNFQYSSIGNAAIDKSLDEFIQTQELKIDRFEEEAEGYNSPPPKKQESVDDFTDDTCTESEKRPTMAGIIEIKLEQKHFLTIDERRRTLHREDAIQRNSTRSVDDESAKSSNASHEKNLDKTNSQSDVASATSAVQGQSSVIDTEIAVPVLEKAKVNVKAVKVPIRRQKTMPVQIESNVIRVLPPKHLRKRIRSADSDKKKRIHKQ